MIPTNEPILDGYELEYVTECLRKNRLSMGQYVERFEKESARFIGVNHAVAVSHGTAAIHLALLAAGIGPGDEVIIPDLTIIVSASAVIACRARPVLVDVDEYGCLDPTLLESAITEKTKAIMSVHLYGMPANITAIMAIAKKHDLLVIEDVCSAIGAIVGGRRVGGIGDAGAFSFYATKTVMTGEGGMVVTNKKTIADRVRLLRNQAFGSPNRFVHQKLGWNYRMTDVQAAIGLAQLETVEHRLKQKRVVAKRYGKLFQQISGIATWSEPAWGKSSWWVYPVLVDRSFGRSRDDVIRRLREKGIETERFFTPMHKQPVFRQGRDPRYPDTYGKFPRSTQFGSHGLYLPSSPRLTKKEQEFVVQSLVSLKR